MKRKEEVVASRTAAKQRQNQYVVPRFGYISLTYYVVTSELDSRDLHPSFQVPRLPALFPIAQPCSFSFHTPLHLFFRSQSSSLLALVHGLLLPLGFLGSEAGKRWVLEDEGLVGETAVIVLRLDLQERTAGRGREVWRERVGNWEL
jgi:hypothetical protein